jgi:hypothetical protein
VHNEPMRRRSDEVERIQLMKVSSEKPDSMTRYLQARRFSVKPAT